MEKSASDETIMNRIRTGKYVRNALIITTAIFLGYVHYYYVSTLFENNRNFSHLSEMEREMSFRTEMGFYYSYYKTIVSERTFMLGISKLMYDKLVEYPQDVNAFNRFNIHPEVIIGSIYRYIEPWINTTEHRECHMVHRGEGLTPVKSCIGLGEPIIFYLEVIWWLSGLTVAAILVFATFLSNSLLGGILAVAQYFTNHGECTRVMWTPNERENFAAPLILLQAFLLSIQLRRQKQLHSPSNATLQVLIFILNSLCLLFWQFTQFIFLTQTAIFFVMEQLRIIDVKTLYIFLHSHFCGLHMAVLLLQGNDMLETSLYTSFFLVVSIYCIFLSSFRIKVTSKSSLLIELWLIMLRISIVTCASVYLKKVISDFMDVEEDSHIWDILYAKFTNFRNFHTMLYICNDVFDFLPWGSVVKLFKSFLIPFVSLAVFNVANKWMCDTVNRDIDDVETEDQIKTEDKSINAQDEDDSGIENNVENKIIATEIRRDMDVLEEELKKENKDKEDDVTDNLICFLMNLKIDAAIFYNISQMAVYGVMAGLVMRLKLLLVPQMCVVSSLIMNKEYYLIPKSVLKYLPFLWALMMLSVSFEMMQNISTEMSHIGEFSNIEQEELLEWISRETSPGEAFAGSMPILASVMLSTRRPIVAHPHYEHKEARNRAYSAYKVYGKFTPLDLYHEMTKLKATYLIVERTHCYGRSSKGCTYSDIWDLEYPQLRSNPRICHILLTEQLNHFYPVFRNGQYSVFRIHDLSVRYMPRSFDT